MNRSFFEPSNYLMGAKSLGLLLLILFGASFPAPVGAQVFQWTDARGIIHFTDNLDSVPQPVRDSPQLIIWQNLASNDKNVETPTFPEIPRQEPLLEEKPPETTGPAEREPAKLPQQVVHYSPQHTTIVVVNNTTIVRRPKERSCVTEGCKPVLPQLNFNDRRYVHPSAFDGGPRQYIQPR